MAYTRTADWQGMNWIRQDKRLAIYLRDGLACVWCGQGIEDGITLSLDHITPHSAGGSNEASNLVTACSGCNSRRGDRNASEFAKAVAGYVNHGVTATDIEMDILHRTGQKLTPFRKEAKEMIARRGSAARAIAAL